VGKEPATGPEPRSICFVIYQLLGLAPHAFPIEYNIAWTEKEKTMVLKTKLSLGLGFLFLIIFGLAFLCSFFVGKLGQETENILKDNYASIVYAKNMLAGLDDMKTAMSSVLYSTNRSGTMSEYYERLFESGKNTFEANLKEENRNVTEIQEKEHAEALSRDYAAFAKLCLQMKSGFGASSIYVNDFLPASGKLRQSINSISDINMEAVVRKSQSAKHDASRFGEAMAIVGALCLILAFAYFWYFPVYISTTISYLASRMKSLLKRSGLSFEMKTDDESHVILQGINLLENKLGVKDAETEDAKDGAP
jgi:hypothetical protein